jgi:type II secretory pathway component GspD/PulD (secretin)
MNRVQMIIFFVLAGALMAVPLLSRGAAPGAPAAQAQRDGRADYSFRDISIEEAFAMLSQKAKVNIILSKGVTGKVSVNLYGVTVKDAIYSIARAAGYWVEVRNGDYVILGKETGLDYPAANTEVKTFKVQYSDPKQVADILSKYASRYGKITPLVGRKLIVVEDLPSFVDRIEKLLKKLDVQPKQVLIEAKILEVTLNASQQYGIDWKKVFGSVNSVAGSLGTTQFASGTAAAPNQGFFFSLINNNIQAYFSALASKGLVRTLATPKLLALENQEASVVIGNHTGYVVTTTINLVTSQTIDFLDSGVILRVTPSVDQQGRVLLKVHPEVSSASISAAGVPSKKTTEVTTELLCDDGQSVFIGGLINSQGTRQKYGVPILGDLPGIGSLFSSTNDTATSTETVVIITPYVINNPRDADLFSQEQKKHTDNAAGLILDERLNLQGDTSSDPAVPAPAPPPGAAPMLGPPRSPFPY